MNSLNVEQKDFLVKYMSDHEEFAKGHKTNLGTQGKLTFDEMWDDLADDLNDLTDNSKAKSSAQYQEIWNNARLAAKTQQVEHLQSKRRTGNVQPSKTEELDPYLEKISSIFNNFALDDFVNSDEEEPSVAKKIPSSETRSFVKDIQKKYLVAFFKKNEQFLILQERWRTDAWRLLSHKLNTLKNNDKDDSEELCSKSEFEWHRTWKSIQKRVKAITKPTILMTPLDVDIKYLNELQDKLYKKKMEELMKSQNARLSNSKNGKQDNFKERLSTNRMTSQNAYMSDGQKAQGNLMEEVTPNTNSQNHSVDNVDLIKQTLELYKKQKAENPYTLQSIPKSRVSKNTKTTSALKKKSNEKAVLNGKDSSVDAGIGDASFIFDVQNYASEVLKQSHVQQPQNSIIQTESKIRSRAPVQQSTKNAKVVAPAVNEDNLEKTKLDIIIQLLQKILIAIQKQEQK